MKVIMSLQRMKRVMCGTSVRACMSYDDGLTEQMDSASNTEGQRCECRRYEIRPMRELTRHKGGVASSAARSNG